MGKLKIYVFCNSCSHEWHHAMAMCEDGHVLAQHVCSQHEFIPGDMGVDDLSDWSGKRKLYAQHCPDGYEIVWLESAAEAKASAGLAEAYARNQALRLAAPGEEVGRG